MISNCNRSGKLSDNKRDRRYRAYTDVRSGSFPVADSDKSPNAVVIRPKIKIIERDGRLTVSE